MAKYYKTDGSIKDVQPANGKFFVYKELQGFIVSEGFEEERMVQIVPLPDGIHSIVVNEEGKLIPLPVNLRGTAFWREVYPIDKYPNNNDGLIVGNMLVVSEKELEQDEDDK